jgi:hypothetical protein
MSTLATKIGQFISRCENSEILDKDGHRVRVESTSNGGTRLDSNDLASSGPVRDFVDAVRNRPVDEKH